MKTLDLMRERPYKLLEMTLTGWQKHLITEQQTKKKLKNRKKIKKYLALRQKFFAEKFLFAGPMWDIWHLSTQRSTQWRYFKANNSNITSAGVIQTNQKLQQQTIFAMHVQRLEIRSSHQVARL